MKNLKLFRWYDRSVGTVAALNWAAIINHIYPPRKSHLHAHYTPRSYLATQIFLSFICLLLDRNRKGSPAFEAALICSFRSSGRRRGVCVWRAESEQPSKRKLSQSFWHRHWRVVPFLILHEVRHFSPDASLCEWREMDWYPQRVSDSLGWMQVCCWGAFMSISWTQICYYGRNRCLCHCFARFNINCSIWQSKRRSNHLAFHKAWFKLELPRLSRLISYM